MAVLNSKELQLSQDFLKRFAVLTTVVTSLLHVGETMADELDDLLGTDLDMLMDMTVVTPARKGQTVAEAPASVTVITREMIQRRGYLSLEDALKDVPGFDFTTGQPAGEYPTHFLYRGVGDVGQTKMLIMEDGIVLNDVSNGWARHVGYDFMLNDVEKIEIIGGPGSALYGANAYAGLVNVITRSAGEAPPGLTVEILGLGGQHGTASPEGMARYRFDNGVSLQLAGRWYRTDGDDGADRSDPGRYFHGNAEPDSVLTTEFGNIANERNTDGSRLQVPDGFGNDVDDVFLRGRVTRDGFTIGFNFWDQDEGLGSEVVGYEYFANTAGIEYRAHHRGYAAYAAYESALTDHLDSHSRVYFRSDRILPETGFTYTYQYQSVDNGTDPAVADKKKGYHGEGFVVGLEQQLNLDLSERDGLVVGLQLEQEIKEHWGISLGPDQDANLTIIASTWTDEQRSVQPVFFSQNAALYGQYEYRLDSKHTITAGLRFDGDDEYGHVFNPRLGVVRNPTHGLGFKLLYGEAFKAPTVFEQFDEWRGNEQLKPEQIATGEGELSYHFSERAVVRGGFFYSRLTDLIVVAPNPDPLQVPIGPLGQHLDYYQNIGSTSVHGFTVTGDFQLRPRLFAFANYSLTRGDDGDDLDNISAHKLNAGLNYQHPHLNANLRARWRGQIKAPASNLYFQTKDGTTVDAMGYDYVTEASPDGFMDGHLVVDLALTGRDLLGNDSVLEPQFIARNLLGEDYVGIGRQSGSGVRPVDELQPTVQNPSGFIPAYHPQPGRELFLVLRYRLAR